MNEPIRSDRQSAGSADETLLLLVRHCRPHEGHPQAPGDPPLADDGRSHARQVAAALAAAGIDRIVASPQRRARETAQPLSDLLSIPVEIVEGLAEVDLHAERYRSPETIRAELPDRWDEFVRSPAAFFGLDEMAYRAAVLSGVAALLGRGHRTVAVFSHGTPIKIVLREALGLDSRAPLTLDHGSVTPITGTTGDGLRLRCLEPATPTTLRTC
ncbi:histidine phosphatase family protein [Chelatococcus reniformis]|uniref:Phosphoglycerate mutase n=1 Tax=Chelatococcus reniformis TaxID=1494448 RepID=A0A916UAL9_9HYPH|nr:histidine phosphatase family protein [Chelatococcus reniformis]GGC65557.1 phosphoglycerate mutase [Chelatococcus reniformis]